MDDTDHERLKKPNGAKVPRGGNCGSVDNRDTLKHGQWDRSGAGEIEDGSPSTVGADPDKPHNDSKTSAGV